MTFGLARFEIHRARPGGAALQRCRKRVVEFVAQAYQGLRNLVTAD
jgi:hypothetical protein